MATRDRSVLVALISTAGVIIAALIAAGYFKRDAGASSQTTSTRSTSAQTTDTAPAAPPVASLPRVVVHVAKGDPRNLADKVRQHLLAAGADVPAIVSVTPSTAPSA